MALGVADWLPGFATRCGLRLICSEDLKTMDNCSSGSLGIPCHKVWEGDGYERWLWRGWRSHVDPQRSVSSQELQQWSAQWLVREGWREPHYLRIIAEAEYHAHGRRRATAQGITFWLGDESICCQPGFETELLWGLENQGTTVACVDLGHPATVFRW
jgi:hypothetical protein